MKRDIWTPLANELQVPWRAAESMHWLIGETDMARRAGSALFSMTGAGSKKPASLSSSSSASGMERYGPSESVRANYEDYDEPGRASEEADLDDTRRRRRGADMQQQGQQLAPVGRGFEAGSGHELVLPSLAELTGGVPAFMGLNREGRY